MSESHGLPGADLPAQNRLLKAENQILRSKLPKRIMLDNQQRAKIIKHGLPLGGKLKDLLSIVSYSTFRRWVRETEDGPTPDKKPKDAGDAKNQGDRPKTGESQLASYTPCLVNNRWRIVDQLSVLTTPGLISSLRRLISSSHSSESFGG